MEYFTSYFVIPNKTHLHNVTQRSKNRNTNEYGKRHTETTSRMGNSNSNKWMGNLDLLTGTLNKNGHFTSPVLFYGRDLSEDSQNL